MYQNSTSNSVPTQTDQHPDIPYLITSALPPIFSSQLCHRTPKINFLSSSVPNLDSICWIKNDDDDPYLDEAEEFLSEQYDREISNFYLEKQEQARVNRAKKLLQTDET